MRSNWPVNWLRFVLNCSPCLGRTVLKAWLFFAVPNLRMGNGTVQLLEKLLGVAAGVEKAVVLADPSNLGILMDDAELLVYRINYSPNVSHCHGSVLIQRELQIGQFLWLNLVNGEAVLCIVTDCGHCCAPSSFSKYEPASRLGFRFSRVRGGGRGISNWG